MRRSKIAIARQAAEATGPRLTGTVALTVFVAVSITDYGAGEVEVVGDIDLAASGLIATPKGSRPTGIVAVTAVPIADTVSEPNSHREIDLSLMCRICSIE
jgi:hypothetical protein